jgi:hypothetical protein
MTVQMMVELLATAELSQADLTDIEDAFRTLDLRPVTRIMPTRRGPDTALFVIAALPAQAFLKALLEQVGSDAHQALRALAERVLRRAAHRRGSPRSLVLESTETGARIVLEADLPPDAYRHLFEQLSDQQLDDADHQLRYDRRRRRWSDIAG